MYSQIGGVVLLLFWAIHTLKTTLAPKIDARLRAVKFDINTGDDTAKKKAIRRLRIIRVSGFGMRVMGWFENALLVLIAAWSLFVVPYFIRLLCAVLMLPSSLLNNMF